METLLASLRKAHTVTAELFRGLAEAHWQLRTPCIEWDVRQLANHMVGGYRLFSAGLTGTAPAGDFEKDWLGDQPREAYAAAATEVLNAWQTPGALDRPVQLSVGLVPAQLGLLIHLTEVVVHGIDLAVATDQAGKISQASAHHLLAAMKASEAMEQFRVPGVFGPELPAPAGATAHEQLMAYLGRTPATASLRG